MNTRTMATTVSLATLTMLAWMNPIGAAAGDRSDGASPLVVTAESNRVRIFHDADGDYFRLKNGDEFKLTPLPESVRKEIEANAARVDAERQEGELSPFGAAEELPPVVD